MAVRAVKAIGLDVGGVDFLTHRHHRIVQGHRRRHLRGQRRARLPDAHGAERGPAARRGRPGDRHAVPAGHARAGSRSPRSPAPTARPRPRACWRTSTSWPATTSASPRTDGVYIDGQRTVTGDMTGPVATRMVLSDPTVDVAVLEIARGGLLRAGMGVRHCDVGAVLNVQVRPPRPRGIDTLEELAKVKRIVVEVARDTAVLNADDPLCLKMADYTAAKHLCYVTMDPTHALVRRAHPGRRPRRGARVGHQRPDDHDLRSRRPHSAALDPPHPGDARGPGAAQRAERDVRRGDGLQHGRSSSRTSATGSAPSTRRSSRRRAG